MTVDDNSLMKPALIPGRNCGIYLYGMHVFFQWAPYSHKLSWGVRGATIAPVIVDATIAPNYSRGSQRTKVALRACQEPLWCAGEPLRARTGATSCAQSRRSEPLRARTAGAVIKDVLQFN